MQSRLLRELDEVIRRVAHDEILSRFRKLESHHIVSKATHEDPTDIVTEADRSAESVLSVELPKLFPGSRVLGEEAASADASVLGLLDRDEPVWVVDPLDGTRNFAAGSGPFGTMVALAHRGDLLASGIYLPLTERMFLAERGQGAFLDGAPLRGDARPLGDVLSGSAYTKFLSRELAARVESAQRERSHDIVPGVVCAAHEYTEVALGTKDYVVYHRLLPWDHAPGVLLVREAGGVVRHPGGRDYHVSDREGPLLITPSEAAWQRAQGELFGGAT